MIDPSGVVAQVKNLCFFARTRSAFASDQDIVALVCIEVSGDGKGGHLAARAVTQNTAGFIDPNPILVLKEMR